MAPWKECVLKAMLLKPGNSLTRQNIVQNATAGWWIHICVAICVDMIYVKAVRLRWNDLNLLFFYSFSLKKHKRSITFIYCYRNAYNILGSKVAHFPAEKLFVIFSISITFFVLANACWTLSWILGGNVDLIVEVCQFFCFKFSWTVLLSDEESFLFKADSLSTRLLF